MSHRNGQKDYSKDPNRDPMAVLSPEARAEYDAMPREYRKEILDVLLGEEAERKHPRRNQSIEEIFAREKRRRERTWVTSCPK